MPPLRTWLTIGVALLVVALIAWVMVRLPRARELGGSRPRRMFVAAAVMIVLAAFVAWLLAIVPAYWD